MMNKKKVERKYNSVRGLTLWAIFMGQEIFLDNTLQQNPLL